jgi:hypothetical protein
MDYLLSHLGTSKITQVIATNRFEQSADYFYPELDGSGLFEDLLNKKRVKSLSSMSLQSNESSGATDAAAAVAAASSYVSYGEDSFMYLMYFVQHPTITLQSKDTVVRTLRDFRRSLVQNPSHFNIKKLSRTDKNNMSALFTEQEPIRTVDDAILAFFSALLKVNIVAVVKNTIFRAMLCADEAFDSVLMIDPSGRGHFRMAIINGNTTTSLAEVKSYMFDKRMIDAKLVEGLLVNDLRSLAEKMGISTWREVDGKRFKRLKDELKSEVLKRI